MKNKKTAGRPRKYESGKEARTVSIRLTPNQRAKIMKECGSIASFIELAYNTLFSKK